MSELPFLDGYDGQTTDELIGLKDQYRIDSLLLAFEEALGQKEARAGTENLTEEERTVLAVEALEREVNNGGYGQFFTNFSCEYVPIIVGALKRINCPATAETAQEAVAVLGIGGELTTESIIAAMEADNTDRDDALQQCDERFYQTGESIENHLFEFIVSNRASIVL